MADMKEYLVTTDNENLTFIVSAKNAKDAISQVWDTHMQWENSELQERNEELGYKRYRMYTKSDINARSLGSLHNEQGKILCI